ncbi:MAG: RecQ family ATP-dependent DNA helicase [Cyanobacteriota bacterium]
MKKELEILKKYWGYDSFRDSQEEIIKNILENRDAVILLATGGGKSICFQVPALLTDGLCIVISPLISLMQDQVSFLQKKNISADFLNSTLLPNERNKIFDKIKKNQLKFLYLSPEQLISKKIVFCLKNTKINRIIIDEAHCISEWGHDFRPEYKKISENIKNIYENIQICAFTATANKKTIEEIKNILKLKDPFISVSSFDRKNLFLEVEKYYIPFNKFRKLKKIILTSNKTLVYCSSRKETEENQFIFQKKFKLACKSYHAGLNSEKRKNIQDDFKNGNIKLLFATSAFGMGIDIPDIDSVIYWNFPSSIEEYYQGIGRAGRDSSINAKTYLLYSSKDIENQKNLLKNEIPSEKIISNIINNLKNDFRFIQITQKYKIKDLILNQIMSFYEKFDSKEIKAKIIEIQLNKTNKLQNMIDYSKTKSCKRKFILNFFGEEHNGSCNSCSNCYKISTIINK